MTIASRVDDFGRPAWVGLMVLSFILWWPLGLAMLGFMIGSGRMTCWSDHSSHRWQRRMQRMQAKAGPWFGGPDWGSRGGGWRSSGNSAFDEYRTETLHRLEGEQREFRDFLERLRHAKDKAEFDQFMAERSRRPDPPSGV
jgi:Protein of unknown function (DUF2852)